MCIRDSLKVTEEGHKFLKKPKSFKITEDNDFEETEEEVPARGDVYKRQMYWCSIRMLLMTDMLLNWVLC